ncbi:MAG: SIMPL domain-containing protein [Actinobacteria bacterium]|nr:SIMPL domain-containing protein [Actinomycetota bacterium]
MRRILIGAVAASLLLAACTPDVTITNASAGTPQGINVTGQGKVSGTPDTLTIDLGVSVRGDSVTEAVQEAATLADRLIAALEKGGVAEKDIQTVNYSISPEYDYRNDTRKLLGYRVTNTISAKIRDIAAAGTVIDAATAAGGDAVQVSGVRFSLEDNGSLLEAARKRAWEDARAKAEQLAALSGVTLGSPTSISETLTTPPAPVFRASSDLEAASTPIQPGSQTVTVTLSVEFSISG